MEIIYGYKSYQAERRSALTIGNFDGFHRGHKRILETLVDTSRISETRSVLLSFLPHPLQLLMPDNAPRAITPLEDKIRLLGTTRLEVLAILDFDRTLSRMTADEFVREIIVGVFQAQQVFVGRDFTFGHRRTGNVSLLQKLGRELNFQVCICPQVVVRGGRVSSTRIRNLIRAGQISTANRLLGRFFSMSGKVASGRGLGRKSLFPTLNLHPGDELTPQPGVYITHAMVNHQPHASVTNVGWRPTVAGKDLTVETHLIDTNLEATPDHLNLAFLHRLRDEKQFGSLQELRAQIARDCQRSRRFFRLFSRFGQTLETLV